MSALTTLGIFLAAALAELGGTYAVWRWLREVGHRCLRLPGWLPCSGTRSYRPTSRPARTVASLPPTPGCSWSARPVGVACRWEDTRPFWCDRRHDRPARGRHDRLGPAGLRL